MDVDILARSTTTAAEGLPRRRFTVAEVEAMVEAGIMQDDERIELIGGELELWVIDAVRLRTRMFREPTPDGYAVMIDRASDQMLEPLVAPAVFALALGALPLD